MSQGPKITESSENKEDAVKSSTAPGLPKKVVSLKLDLGGDRAPRTYHLHKHRIVIGSVESADVHLEGDGVAPIHAVIEQNDESGEVSIYDLASDTGVFINGERQVTSPLKQNDQIKVGIFSLGFSHGSLSDIARQQRSKPTQSDDGRSLFVDPDEDFSPLLLEEDGALEQIFDYRPSERMQALEVVMSWKGVILDVQHFVTEKSVTLGSEEECDFGIPPLLGDQAYPVAVQAAEGFHLHIAEKMEGVVQTQGDLLGLEQARRQGDANEYGHRVPLGQSEFAKISVGELDFYISYTAAPPRLKRPKVIAADPFFTRILGSSLALSIALMAAMLSADVEPQKLEAEKVPERIATILYQPEKFAHKPRPKRRPTRPDSSKTKPRKKPKVTKINLKPKKRKTLKKVPKVMNTGTVAKNLPKKLPKKTRAESIRSGGKAKRQKVAKEGAGRRAKGKSGVRGSKTARKNKVAQNRALRASARGGKGRGGGKSQVDDIGNIDFLKGAGSKIKNILSGSSANLGKKGSKVKGFGGFDTRGRGGLALSGDGKGGGGDASRLGGLAKRGRGGGRVGTGQGAAGRGSGIIGGRVRVDLRRGGAGERVVMGAIDGDAIEAALLAHRDEFRLCYEREIDASNPGISGTVVPSFTIGSSGRVSRAAIASSSLKNRDVERCVLKVIRRIQFPIPRGAGIVEVRYPFDFSSRN